MRAEGIHSIVEFTGETVTVTSAWPGGGKGESYTIAVDRITAVELKPAAMLSPGQIRFAHPGSANTLTDALSRASILIKERDRVEFRKKDQAQFEALRKAVLDRIAVGSGGKADPINEIARLKHLLDDGALTEEEFTAAKRRLLKLDDDA